MQRGTVRPRADSDEDTEDRPRQRHRQSTAAATFTPPLLLASHNSPSTVTGTLTTALTSSYSPTSTSIATPMSGNMGPPLNSHSSRDNEAGPSNGFANGSSNTFSRPPTGPLRDVQKVSLDGSLMYEDDKDWEEQVESRDREAAMAIQGDEGVFETAPRRSHQPGDKRMPIDREEVVRLILQGLKDIGYNQSASMLEAESGYVLASTAVTDFQNAILGGRWAEALVFLPNLGINSADDDAPATMKAESTSDGSPAASINESSGIHVDGSGSSLSVTQQVKFLIAQQKYLEYLELGQQKKALATLRTELAPVAKDSDDLHTLSGYMMCLDKDDLYKTAGWDGAAGQSRRKLLERLQDFVSPTIMVPQRRLATLLDQARQYQAQSCIYHSEAEAPSLYVDHECKPGQFPSVTTHILADHHNEVWRIEWSPDGLLLASAGKDRQVVVWKLEAAPKPDGGNQWNIHPLYHLKDHREPVDVMAWSPDGKTLVTGADRVLYFWDITTGQQKTTPTGPSPHSDQISAIQWKPDGSEIIVSSLDCKVVFYSPTGAVLRQWLFNSTQLVDFVLTPDMTRLVAATTSLKRVSSDSKLKPAMSARVAERRIGEGRDNTELDPPIRSVHHDSTRYSYDTMEHGLMVVRLADKEVVDWTQDLGCEITGIRMSSDGEKVILSCNPHEIQLWAVEPRLRPVRNFRGHVHREFLIRSCFGAAKDRFVLSGSEDGHVYVWQNNSPHPVQVLAGHQDAVNNVAWNPVSSRRMFASCSDDMMVRIWQSPDAIQHMNGRSPKESQTDLFQLKDEPADLTRHPSTFSSAPTNGDDMLGVSSMSL